MFRRELLLGALALGSTFSLGRSTGMAKSSCSYSNEIAKNHPLVKQVLATADNTYAAYPHSNGFLADGRLVIAQRDGELLIRYAAVDFANGAKEATPLATIRGARMGFCVSQTSLLIAPTLFGAEVVDLEKAGKSILSWQDPEYKADPARLTRQLRFNQDVDIAADGRRAVLTRVIYDESRQVVRSSVVVLEIPGGTVRTVAEAKPEPRTGKIPPLDHAHFSPADPEWICYCDALPNTTRRMWAWHPTKANPARPLADESAQSKPLLFTHERALFDRLALLAIVYGASSGTPRGLYEVPFSGAPPRLISELNCDLHCNASRDGRWYVVSLQGAADLENNGETLDLCARSGARNDPNWLRSSKGYSFSDIVLVNPKNGERVFLYEGANANDGQPYEVQPSISPDGRWVVLKDARRRNVLGLEVNHSALQDFLRV